MLEIRKNTFSKSYENSFFREFSRHLYNSFKEKDLSGVLIGSPLCEVDERLQIDALLITAHVVCIIDFKNYKGKVKLPAEKEFEFGLWINETGEQIKGGSSINPFIQLKNQKRRFIEVSNKHIQNQFSKTDVFNPFHLIRVICFQEEVELIGKIPPNEALNFFILNRTTFIEGIFDIIDVSDKEVNLSKSAFDAFKKVFIADLFNFDDKPLEDKLKEVSSKSSKHNFNTLYDDQKAALTEIKTFLENQEQQVFVLQGTTNSGKSYLIPFIQELAYNLGIQETEIFASSSRVANNLLTIGGLERVNSIYSYIYGGQKNNKQEEQDKEKENCAELEETVDSEEMQIEKIPLKNCDNAENALFIVDESQLVSDSFNQSIDLIFGTGYLLKDFLSFTNSTNTKRKIIFIGDPFQLQLGKTDESPLNPLYLEEAYKLKTSAYQLLDKPDFSTINKEALFCVDNIRTNYFNSLKFEQNIDFKILSDDIEKENVISDLVTAKKGHLLYFRNEDVQERNLKIKNDILKNGEDIAIGDLVVFNNNIETKNDNPDAFPKKILNGQFAIITQVTDHIKTEPIYDRKGKLISNISFREIMVKLSESGYESCITSFENFRNSPTAVLSNNEITAFKIFLYRLANKELDNFIQGKYKADEELTSLLNDLKNGKKVKTKINKKIQSILRTMPSTEYYKIKNSALLRFGWAMTVHKSMSYKWQEVIFNVEKAGTTNENHYRWLYTGISRARKKVSLINYRPISPFDKTELIDSNSGIATNEFFYIAESKESENRLTEFKDFVLSKLIAINTEIERVENLSWQERYHLKRNSKTTIISFSYNGQGKFKFPSLTGGDTVLGNEIIEWVKSKNTSFDLCVVKDIWRKKQYESLSKLLNQNDISVSQIIQTTFKDRIKLLNKENEEVDLEIDYNGIGAFSKITAKYYSNPNIWHNFKNAIEQIKA